MRSNPIWAQAQRILCRFLRKRNRSFNQFNYTGSAPGAGKIILGHAPRYRESMVQFRCIYVIHPAELLPKNGPKTTRLHHENMISETWFGRNRGLHTSTWTPSTQNDTQNDTKTTTCRSRVARRPSYAGTKLMRKYCKSQEIVHFGGHAGGRR